MDPYDLRTRASIDPAGTPPEIAIVEIFRHGTGDTVVRRPEGPAGVPLCKIGPPPPFKEQGAMRRRPGPTEETMTSERQQSPIEPQGAGLFEDDVTWHGLVERAMRAAHAGTPDPVADRCVVEVALAAVAAGLHRALLASTTAEACAYVRSLVSRARPTVALKAWPSSNS